MKLKWSEPRACTRSRRAALPRPTFGDYADSVASFAFAGLVMLGVKMARKEPLAEIQSEATLLEFALVIGGLGNPWWKRALAESTIEISERGVVYTFASHPHGFRRIGWSQIHSYRILDQDKRTWLLLSDSEGEEIERFALSSRVAPESVLDIIRGYKAAKAKKTPRRVSAEIAVNDDSEDIFRPRLPGPRI